MSAALAHIVSADGGTAFRLRHLVPARPCSRSGQLDAAGLHPNLRLPRQPARAASTLFIPFACADQVKPGHGRGRARLSFLSRADWAADPKTSRDRRPTRNHFRSGAKVPPVSRPSVSACMDRNVGGAGALSAVVKGPAARLVFPEVRHG